MSARSRREAPKTSQNKRAGALARLKELKQSGKKHLDSFDFKEEDDLYVEGEEEEVDDFVVDDGVGGYGKDEYDDINCDAGLQAPKAISKQKGSTKIKTEPKDSNKGTKRKAEETRRSYHIGKLFSKHAGATRGPSQFKSEPEEEKAKDAEFELLLKELETPHDRRSVPQMRQLGGRALPNPAVASSLTPASKRKPDVPGLNGNPLKRTPVSSSSIRLKKRPKPAVQLEEDFWQEVPGHSYEEEPEADDAEAVQPEPMQTAECASDQDIDEFGKTEAHVKDGGRETPRPQPDRLRHIQAAETSTPQLSGPQAEPVGQTPWKTPAPIFAEPATPATAVAASGWQELCTAPSDASKPAEKEEPWVDDGSLPLEGDVMPLYLLDAVETPGSSEVVYLFGKVPKDGSFHSCCVRVKLPERTLFFIPKPGELSDDGELKELEEATAKDPSKKMELLRYVHALAEGVKKEVKSTLQRNGINDYSVKPVQRSYAFEMATIPRGKQWVLKVKYSSSSPQLKAGISGERFAAVLGLGQSPLESLMLKRKIKGPSWLLISKPSRIETSAQVSWCKFEVEVARGKSITSAAEQQSRALPPLVVAALSIKTIIKPQNNTSEIVAASVVYLRRVRIDRQMGKSEWNTPQALRYFSVLRKLEKRPFPIGFEELMKQKNESPAGRFNGGPTFTVQGSERGLLAFLLARLQEIDADVYTGHNISGFDLDILLQRFDQLKLPQWSRIGRLKLSKVPNLSGGGYVFGGGASPGILTALAGRLICDTYLSARELVKEVDFTLRTLSHSLLHEERHELSPVDVPGKFESAAKLMELLEHAASDAWLSLGLSFYLSVLPLTRQLSEVSGSLWTRALQGQRAQRIEMLLLHEFHERKFLLPDKLRAKEREQLAKAAKMQASGLPEQEQDEDAKKGKGPQYAGGLVLEPKRGLYDKLVLVLDFNSLYPSIIQEYNICFTTVEATLDGSRAALPRPTSELAPLPRVIQDLVRRRREVKAILAKTSDPMRRAQLDIRQQALKLTANSMYGCLGFTASRFYAQPLAELITAQGRHILQSTVDLVQGRIGAEVIYGDTDSIMVATDTTDYQQGRALGERIKKEVNKHYGLLEIELDAVFKCMLLLKKKKYAAVKLEAGPNGSLQGVPEQKGLDMVRRDWCPLSKDVGNYVLEQILSGNQKEEVVEAVHAKLREVRKMVDEGKIPVHKFLITKQLTKKPEDYGEAKNFPHVQVALRRIKQHKREGVARGETVPYIICLECGEDGQPILDTGKSQAERAYHLDEVRDDPRLAVDTRYYLESQVHPVVARLCDPIEGTDSARLADCLGLDPSKFKGHSNSARDHAMETASLGCLSFLDDDELYKDCAPLILRQGKDTTWNFQGIEGILRGSVDPPSVLAPPHEVGEGKLLSASQLVNQVQLQVRDHVSKFYEFSLISDDPTNEMRTCDICCRVEGESEPGTLPPDFNSSAHMRPVVTERALYLQLTYFLRMLDVDRLLRRLASDKERSEAVERVAPVRSALDAAAEAVRQAQNQSAYKWIDLGRLCGIGPVDVR